MSVTMPPSCDDCKYHERDEMSEWCGCGILNNVDAHDDCCPNMIGDPSNAEDACKYFDGQ